MAVTSGEEDLHEDIDDILVYVNCFMDLFSTTNSHIPAKAD